MIDMPINCLHNFLNHFRFPLGIRTGILLWPILGEIAIQPHLDLTGLINPYHVLSNPKIAHLLIELAIPLQGRLIDRQTLRKRYVSDFPQPQRNPLTEDTDEMVAALHPRNLSVVDVL
jgi:hypothetical protein